MDSLSKITTDLKQPSSAQSQLFKSTRQIYSEEFTFTQRRPHYSRDPTHQSSHPSQVFLDTNKHSREKGIDELLDHQQNDLNQPQNTCQKGRKQQSKTLFPRVATAINTEMLQTDRYSNERSKTNYDTLKKPNSRFKAFGNLVVSIRRLQQNIVNRISNISQLTESIIPSKQTPNLKQTQIHPQSEWESMSEILFNLKMIDKFVSYAEQGSEFDIKEMKKLLSLDPKKHLRSSTDPRHLLNQRNRFGQNSLYVASKHGNLNVVEFLIQQQCNPHIKSILSHNIDESPLEVAVRWSHVKCVELLLENVSYSRKELKLALNISNNVEIQHLLKSQLIRTNIFDCCL